MTASAPLQVTELCPRGSLFDYLHAKKGGRKLPPALTMRLLLDTAAGVRHLHEATPRCIHRDLKCQNLLLGSGMELKVADFGLSRECFATAAMTRVGSVQWAAPEVLLGHGYSHKCDLWSFGVVCWETMTARVPFDGMSQVLVATRVALDAEAVRDADAMCVAAPKAASDEVFRAVLACRDEVVPQLRGQLDDLLHNHLLERAPL